MNQELIMLYHKRLSLCALSLALCLGGSSYAQRSNTLHKRSIELAITVQSDSYRPARPDQAQVIVTAQNTGTEVVEVPTLGSWSKGLVLRAQAISEGERRDHAFHLMTYQKDQPKALSPVELQPKSKRIVFQARLSDLLPSGQPETWRRDFKAKVGQWTWKAHPTPPPSPLHERRKGEPPVDHVRLWAEVWGYGSKVKSPIVTTD